MTEKKFSYVFPRLQLAYLLQFAIWGSWSVVLGGYLNGKMSGTEIGYLYMAIPLGAIIAPLFIGPIADRYFAAQKVLGLLHLISGTALVLCGVICSQSTGAVPFFPLMILMLLSGICFMPSIPLINAVVFKHIPDSSKQPSIFIFGTVGWIVVNLVVEILAGGAGSPNFFFIGGGCGIFLGLYSFTLPDTPPKGAPAPGQKQDVLGLGALAMFKDPTFTLFVLCAFLVSIFGSNFFFPSIVPYLTEHGYPAAVALTTLNQFSELFFMAALAFCVSRFGLKWVLVLGMSAWALRYLIFTQDGFAFALIGLLFHGLGYAFLYTASYMFGDKVAPDNLKASVQSLLAFLLLGVGQVLSGWAFGYQFDNNPPQMTQTIVPAAIAGSEQPQGQPLPPWDDPKMENSSLRFLDLAKTVKYFTGNKDVFQSQENLGRYQREDGTLIAEDIKDENGNVKDPWILNEKTSYTQNELKATFAEIKEGPITRSEYLAVQRHDWKGFFTPPALFIIFWVAVFIIFGKEPKAAKKENEVSTTPENNEDKKESA